MSEVRGAPPRRHRRLTLHRARAAPRRGAVLACQAPGAGYAGGVTPPPPGPAIHRRELARFVRFVGAFSVVLLASYVVPWLDQLRPWIPGEPVPLAHLLAGHTKVVEDELGELQRVVEPVAEPVPSPTLLPAAVAAAPLPPVPARPPAVSVPLEVPVGALDTWFKALLAAERGEPGVVRALHWGDSTIAADVMLEVVRHRLQDRFGVGGPGFLAVHVDPRWNIRHDIARWTEGDWESLTIAWGGADQPYYGLGGTLAVSATTGKATLGDRKMPATEANPKPGRYPLAVIDVYYQLRPGGGSLYVKPKGAPAVTLSTASGSVGDAFRRLDVPAGADTVYLQATGRVGVYGVALETAGPGVTWENLGVAASSQASMLRQGRNHLQRQVERRQPHLLVYQTGGNEVGFPTLSKGEGEEYLATYLDVLQRVRAGAPLASCLVVSPLDQATRERGQVVSKPLLDRMVVLQREAARQAGCAFWEARAVMGGEGGFAKWMAHRPMLAWTDLAHLTDTGLELVGEVMADALEQAYDHWRARPPSGGGPEFAPFTHQPATPAVP